jgi:hypothetical protein
MKILGLDLSINGSGCVKFELDDKLNVIGKSYLSFTQVKKHETKEILHFSKKNFPNNFEQNAWTITNILAFCEGCEYVAVEDYAFGAKGMVFHIGEFVGEVKKFLYWGWNKNNRGMNLRLYDPCSIKMWATDRGNATKEDMVDSYDKVHKDPLKLSFLNRFGSPKEDIVDAYFIATLLQTELKLRLGLIQLKDLTEKQIQIFNRTTKSHPTNVLATDFYKHKEEK